MANRNAVCFSIQALIASLGCVNRWHKPQLTASLSQSLLQVMSLALSRGFNTGARHFMQLFSLRFRQLKSGVSLKILTAHSLVIWPSLTSEGEVATPVYALAYKLELYRDHIPNMGENNIDETIPGILYNILYSVYHWNHHFWNPFPLVFIV